MKVITGPKTRWSYCYVWEPKAANENAVPKYSVWKFTSPGTDGVPDRIILIPKGRIAFVEVKAPGKKPRRLQLIRHKQLRKLGFMVYVLDDHEQIGDILDEIQTA